MTEANGLTERAPGQGTILELSGHIIDSLTLAKVIDKIQMTGFDYQMNDVQIGLHKKDISKAQLTVWAPTPEDLDMLVEELRVYGVSPVQAREVETAHCREAGQIPGGGYLRHNPPTEILLGGEWVPVRRDGTDYAIVVNRQERGARLCPINQLAPGDEVVLGYRGVKVVPLPGRT
jgi:hypothetical protein